MASATLCVVDMQPYFYASQEEWLMENVLREIRQAKNRNIGIIVIEYEGCGVTDSRILRECMLHSKFVRLVKRESDAAPLILDAVTNHNFSADKFIIAGVETDACITDTINGLSMLSPSSQIVVVADAVNMLGRTHTKRGFKGFHRKSQVVFKNKNVRLPRNQFS